MSTKQLALFRDPPNPERNTQGKPKHKYGAAISDYGTLREWDRPLTPCERRRYLTPFPSGRTYATFYQLKTTPWGWLGRHYEQGSTTMHIRHAHARTETRLECDQPRQQPRGKGTL